MSCSLRCPHFRVSSIRGSTVQSHEPVRQQDLCIIKLLVQSTTYHGEEIDEEVGIPSDDHVGL